MKFTKRIKALWLINKCIDTGVVIALDQNGVENITSLAPDISELDIGNGLNSAIRRLDIAPQAIDILTWNIKKPL